MLTPTGLRALESAATASGVTLLALNGLSFEDRIISILKAWVESTGGTMPSGSFNNRVLAALESIAANGGGGGGSTHTSLATYATARPVSPAENDTADYEDSPLISKYDGSQWLDSLPGWTPYQAPIPTLGWTTIGKARTSLTVTRGVRTTLNPAKGSPAAGGYIRAAASASFRVRALLSIGITAASGGGGVGLWLQDASSSNALGIQVACVAAGELNITINRRPAGVTDSAGQTATTYTTTMGFSGRVYLEVAYNAGNVGTEVTIGVSRDGGTPHVLRTEQTSDSFTTAPDQYAVSGNDATDASQTTLLALDEAEL